MDQASSLRNMARRRRADSAATGAVITLFSGAGATGRTSAALSVASSLAAVGNRVLVIDGSRQSTRFGRFVTGSCGLSAFLGAARPQQSLATSFGFDAVHSDRENVGQVSHLIAEALNREASLYDFVIVDAGDPDVAVDCGAVSSIAVGVTTPEFPSVRDTYAAARVIAGLGTASVGLVVNMAASEHEAMKVYGAVGQTLLRNTGLMVEFAGWVRYLPGSAAAEPMVIPGSDSVGSGFGHVAQWISSRSMIYRERQRESFR